MANYTIELGKLVNTGFKIFDFEYDFYDENKKKDFEQLFIDRFYNYEICCETPLRWQRYLKITMRTKFPYYNMLLVTAQINYEKTKNYNITETQNRAIDNTNNTTGSNTLENNVNSSGSTSGTAYNNGSSTDIGSKNNTLNSTTVHTDNDVVSRTENQTDKNVTVLSDEKTLDHTKVHSTTPKTLLSMDSIKNNVYASDADRETNTDKDNSTNTINDEKNNKINETDNRTVNDTVTATSTEGTRNENTNSNSSTSSNNISNLTNEKSNSTLSQATTGKTQETYTRTMSGSYGVITEADMLQKHIALQEKLTTIYNDFFEECYDLFVGLWN